jgi:hypothetical protein
MQFAGDTYDPHLDHRRLWTSLTAVEHLLQDGQWRTLSSISESLRRDYGIVSSEAGVSARFRDLRKEAFGGHAMESRRVAGGLWEYRMKVPEQWDLFRGGATTMPRRAEDAQDAHPKNAASSASSGSQSTP